ncbi:hypothetical protein BDBG_08805 [Blastomyces gilchristii SLH14081]|uniref:Mediator of RNA polymerase II transcription subunit 4 n=1 Tax=Blastomyces gilchristii (strain SLH14081) TaxID=559298 RepID=A0A179V2G8_BLAGS|nr:uncharacterized protein BDBG_08805 [Blastomyces gilchristii SLH14081]OAT13639.1 hypothetical protein BDBG_08805 [Blastomyces gilchristii SLH14081]
MESQLLTPLSTLETRLNNLLMSIVSSPTAAGAPAAALSLLEADDALSCALKTLHTHQLNYAKILRLRAEALTLEERVRDIVREVENVGNEISTACQEGVGASDDDSSVSDVKIEADGEKEKEGEDVDTQMGGVSAGSPVGLKRAGNRRGKEIKEIDYKLLVNFARRISRYNSDAAADVSASSPIKATPPLGDTDGQGQQTNVIEENGGDAERVGAGGQQGGKGFGVAALSQETVSWLDETANWSRDLSRMAFPSEERIRMGLMGQLQAKANEGVDVEKEIELLIRTSEGVGVDGGGEASAAAGGQGTLMDEVVGIEGEQIGHGRASGGISRADTAVGGVPAPRPKPKAVLDLDLYDPDEDD